LAPTPTLRAIIATAALLVCAATARADIIVDHQPYNVGGPASDTQFSYFGDAAWQQAADDIRLAEPSAAQKLVWWGFYGGQGENPGSVNPPTVPESLRIRFYDARSTDGLPGSVLREETFLNPTRAATGRLVYDGVLHREFRFEADLAMPFNLDSSTTYWLELVQLGNSVIRDSHQFLDGSIAPE